MDASVPKKSSVIRVPYYAESDNCKVPCRKKMRQLQLSRPLVIRIDESALDLRNLKNLERYILWHNVWNGYLFDFKI